MYKFIKALTCMRKIVILLQISLLLMPMFAFSQIGNKDGRYDAVITVAYDILKSIQNEDKSTVKKAFVESGFQTEKEFSHFLTASNLAWAKETITKFGVTPKEEISISEWRTTSRESNEGASINLTFFFKEKEAPFSNINDHISLNFKSKGNKYLLDGIMFFKKDDYKAVKEIIDNIPGQ